MPHPDTFIGFELGADIGANLAHDDFMVYEKNEERAWHLRARWNYPWLPLSAQAAFAESAASAPGGFQPSATRVCTHSP